MKAIHSKLIMMLASVLLYLVGVEESGVAFATDPAAQPGNESNEPSTAIYLPLILSANAPADGASGDNRG